MTTGDVFGFDRVGASMGGASWPTGIFGSNAEALLSYIMTFSRDSH